MGAAASQPCPPCASGQQTLPPQSLPPPPPAAPSATTAPPSAPSTPTAPVVAKPAPSAPTTTPTPAPATKTMDVSAFEKEILEQHNVARRRAGLPELEWDSGLVKKAEDWANYLRTKEQCALRHPIKTKQETDLYLPMGMGQNLYSGFGFPVSPASPENAITGWYNECKDYAPLPPTDTIPKNFDAVGHFTQMMWKKTKKVGCTIAKCPKKLLDGIEAEGDIIVCNYDQGNIGGQFNEMVPFPVECPLKKPL